MNSPDLPDLPAPPPGKHGWPWTEASPPLPPALPDGRPWPRISIVTPSFNQGQFVEETLRSVLLQGYPNLEYVVMDGASTDGSVEIIQKYAPWLAYWVSQPDRGQSHAINQGFARTTGEIMAWLNSDDLYAPGALAQVARELAVTAPAMLVGASTITEAAGGQPMRPDRRRPSWEEMAYNTKTFPQPSVFWTRALWNLSGPLNEQLYYVMDYDLWLRMRPRALCMTFSEAVLSTSRVHPNQKSQFAPTDQLFRRERAMSAAASARLRGEHVLAWLWRVWLHRLRRHGGIRAVWYLRQPGYHWQALQAALRLSLAHALRK